MYMIYVFNAIYHAFNSASVVLFLAADLADLGQELEVSAAVYALSCCLSAGDYGLVVSREVHGIVGKVSP